MSITKATRWDRLTVAERFWMKVRKTDGCWEWLASVNDAGYGQMNVDGKPERAHRIAYRLCVGEIPDGMVLDHLCRNRACVNPAHLEPVTIGENVRRGVAAEAARARKAAQAECKNGHPFDAENTYYGKLRNGSTCRVCRTCRRLKARERRASK